MTAQGIKNKNLRICAAMNKNGDTFTVKQNMPFNISSFNDFMIDPMLYAAVKGYYN